MGKTIVLNSLSPCFLVSLKNFFSKKNCFLLNLFNFHTSKSQKQDNKQDNKITG